MTKQYLTKVTIARVRSGTAYKDLTPEEKKFFEEDRLEYAAYGEDLNNYILEGNEDELNYAWKEIK